MSADITLTFEALGAEKIVAETKKIQDAIKEAAKGLDLSGLEKLTESIDKATAAAEKMNATLADAEVEDLGNDIDDASEAMEGFEKNSGKAKSGLLGFNAATVGIGAALAAAAVAVKAAKAAFDMFTDGIMNAFRAGQEFSKMSAALGMDAGSARVLAQAFEEAGMSAQSVVPMVSKMQRKIAEGSAAFKAIGLDVESLKGKSAIEQIKAIGDAVRGVSDQEGKMKVLMAIFEEAGPQLSKLFNNPDAIKNATETLGSSVRIMRENAEAFDRAAVLISNISTKIGTFFEGVAAGVVNPLNSLLESLNAVDLAAEGEKFGSAIRNAASLYYKAFLNDQFFELLATKFSKSTTSFWQGARDVWAPLQDAFNGTVAGTAAIVETGLDFAGRGLDKVGIKGTNGMTSRKGVWDTFMDYTNENLRAARQGSGAVGDWLTKRNKEWAELERQLMRSLGFDENGSRLNPPPPPKPKEEGSGPGSSGFEFDMSWLLKGLGGSPSFTPKTDALQRIGGTIGGMSGAQLAPARKTADNTSKLVGLANDIRSAIKTRQPSSMVAVYA